MSLIEHSALAVSQDMTTFEVNLPAQVPTLPPLPTFHDAVQLRAWVAQLFGIAPEATGSVWTCSFRDIEGAGVNWFGGAGVSRLGNSPFGAGDYYFSVGLMASGAQRRANANVVAWPVLIVDDIGTKVPLAQWEALFDAGCPRPTAQIETSPGNETWVWALDGEASGAARVNEITRLRVRACAAG